MSRELDVVVFGATGFTGRKAVEYLQRSAPAGLRWGVAARDLQKLASVHPGLPSSVPRFAADALDRTAIGEVARRTRVALSFVGPYIRYGDPLVDACVEHGTDYADITGETLWARGIIDRHHARAAERGTRIVPFCGFDSVPSDLGAFLVVDWIRRTWGVGTAEVFAGFSLKGGVSGGTVASGMATMGVPGAGRVRDPVLLNPEAARTDELRKRSPDFARVAWSDRHERWLTPFFMAPFNTRVVRRSAALASEFGSPYGPGFVYGEAMETRSRATAYGTAATLAAVFSLSRSGTARKLAARFLPAPGEGPSDEAIRQGFYRVRLFARAEDGREALGTFAHDSDPGYGSTITLACEAALTMAVTPREALPGGPSRGGVLTPATALGAPYLDRLRAAGVTAEVAPA